MRKNGLSIACRILYELVGKYLPNKNAWVVGRMAKMIRYRLAKGFVCSMGRGVVIERNARIPSSLCIGDGSGIGCNACIDAQVLGTM